MKGFKKMNKFLRAKNVFERLAFYNIEELNELTDSMYASFCKELDAHEKNVKEIIEKMPKQLHDEFLDHYE